jgi:LPS sulfotransferase NodH
MEQPKKDLPPMQGPEWEAVAADMSPENDFPATRCRFKYLICSTPRSGSWLLATGLASTSLAGRPAEYFTPVYAQAYRLRVGDVTIVPTQYWQFLLDRRTSPNGVFGMKIHFDQMENYFPREQGQKRFLNQFERLIFLTRRDKLAQAVSFLRARKTGIYRLTEGMRADTEAERSLAYRFEDVAYALALVATREARWRSLLADFSDRTFELDYEDLATDYVQSLGRVLVALGLPQAVSAIVPRPQVLQQRDELNAEWERFFLQDLRGGAMAAIGDLSGARDGGELVSRGRAWREPQPDAVGKDH